MGVYPNDRIEYLTKREYFAAAALQGILATQTKATVDAGMWLDPSQIAKRALVHADALLKALDEDTSSERSEPVLTVSESGVVE